MLFHALKFYTDRIQLIKKKSGPKCLQFCVKNHNIYDCFWMLININWLVNLTHLDRSSSPGSWQRRSILAPKRHLAVESRTKQRYSVKPTSHPISSANSRITTIKWMEKNPSAVIRWIPKRKPQQRMLNKSPREFHHRTRISGEIKLMVCKAHWFEIITKIIW